MSITMRFPVSSTIFNCLMMNLFSMRSILLVLYFGLAVCSRADGPGNAIKFHHLRLNVADKDETARWYIENVGLELIPSNNTEVVCVADKDHNFMFEFSSIPNIRNTYHDIHVDGFHCAFEGHRTIDKVAERMIASGAVQQGEIYRNKIGDYVLNVRDRNGLNAQLLHRVHRFYPKPVKSTIRFEHFAYNTPNQMVAALWYAEFLDLKVVWSKDINVQEGNFRNYRVPYVGDLAKSMSVELFGKENLECSFARMTHEECHLGFLTPKAEETAQRMVFGGGKQAAPAHIRPDGEVTIDLWDPFGFPIRLVQRGP